MNSNDLLMIVLVKLLNSGPFITYTCTRYLIVTCSKVPKTTVESFIILKDTCSWIFKKYDALLCYTRYVREGRPFEAKSNPRNRNLRTLIPHEQWRFDSTLLKSLHCIYMYIIRISIKLYQKLYLVLYLT